VILSDILRELQGTDRAGVASVAGVAGLLPAEAVVPGGIYNRVTSVTIASGAFPIYPGPGMDEQAIGRAVVGHLEEILNRL
jgi:hypothetical protein